MLSGIESVFFKAGHSYLVTKERVEKDYKMMIEEMAKFGNGETNDLVEHCLGMILAKLYLNKSPSYLPEEGANPKILKDLCNTVTSRIIEDYILLNPTLVYNLTLKYCELYRAQMYHEYFPIRFDKGNFLGEFLGYDFVMSPEIRNLFNTTPRVANLYRAIVFGIKKFKAEYDRVIL